MNAVRVAACALAAAGIAALAYGKFNYTKSTGKATIGPVELSVRDTQTVNIPVWAGVGAIVLGGILFFMPTRT